MNTIRNYINIINSAAVQRETLVEGQQRFSFLRELINEGRHDDLISQTVTSLKTKFKDNPEAVAAVDKAERLWTQIRASSSFKNFPNKWKMFMAENIRQHMFFVLLDKDQLGIEDTKLAKKMNRNVTERDVRNLFSEFEHFTAFLNHSPIALYDPFGSDDPIGDLKSIQDSMQSVNDEWVESTGEETLIIDMGKYKWFDLGRGACRDEGGAMGHCGNVPSVRSGDTIYSLRQVLTQDGVTYHRPSLTFIANNGIMGEMKGRANNKPNERYHPHIVELLKSKYVTGLKGGGYDPSNNFHPEDLSKEHWDEIAAVKGEDFLDMSPILEVKNVVKRLANDEISTKDATEIIQNSIEEIAYENGVDELSVSGFDEEKYLLVDVDYIEDQSKGYIGYVDGNDHLDVEPYVDDYADYLNRAEKHVYEQTIDYIMETYRDDILDYFDIEEEDFNREFVVGELHEIIKELADDVRGAINTADAWARESGTYSEISKALDNLVETVAADLYADPKSIYELINEKPTYTLRVPLDNVVDLFMDYQDWLRPDRHEIDVPYYGFDGYDDDYLPEALKEQLSEFIDFVKEEEEEEKKD